MANWSKRLDEIQAKRTSGHEQVVVIQGCDESEDEAIQRAKDRGVKIRGTVVIIKRFCMTAAEVAEAEVARS